MIKMIVTAVLVLMPVFSGASMLIDGGETGDATNSLGSSWVTFTDNHSFISIVADGSNAYTGRYGRKVEWTARTGNANGQFAGVVSGLNPSWSVTDLSAYYGIRFYAKGTGSFTVNIPEEETRSEGAHYSASIMLTPDWVLYEIPFSEFNQPAWGTRQVWDPARAYAVGFLATGPADTTGILYVDNLEFYTRSEGRPPSDPNVIILQPKINQLGYLPDEKKFFTVVTNTAAANDAFTVLDAAGNTALTGTISGMPVDDRASSGEGVFKADFSSLTATGTYRISVNGKESFDFKVSENVYDGLFKDALRCFYLIRCGTAVSDPVTGLKHNACHTVPDSIRGGKGKRDLAGGWHNAGDFGKWAHEEAVSCAYMMWLYELKEAKMKNLKVNIPESKNTVSDLLDEAKWGLDWLMKLQNADGTVYHKSDTEPNFCFGTKPEMDPYVRYAAFQGATDTAQTPSSIDAADFTAVMAQAYRVYRNIMPGFAVKCRNAAMRSWSWLKNNRGKGQSDPYYTDGVSWQEEEWAMAEMFRLTGDASISAMFDTDTDLHSLEATGWMAPEFFGYFSLYQDPNTPQGIKDKIKSRITGLSDQLVALAGASGYGVSRAGNEYYWGSNEDVMHKANVLLMAYTITNTGVYKDTALGQLGYILGNNSLNTSFVTKQGTKYNLHPYNWVYFDYNILIPGWASGGPNKYSTGAGNDLPLINLINKGTPPAKCWMDLCSTNGSYASNEGETSENAALVFLSGFFKQ